MYYRNLSVHSKLLSQYICVHLNVKSDLPRKERILCYPFLTSLIPLGSSPHSSPLSYPLYIIFSSNALSDSSLALSVNQPTSDSNKPVRLTKVRAARVTPVPPSIGQPQAVRDTQLHTCRITTLGLINSSHHKCHGRTLAMSATITPTTPAPGTSVSNPKLHKLKVPV